MMTHNCDSIVYDLERNSHKHQASLGYTAQQASILINKQISGKLYIWNK